MKGSLKITQINKSQLQQSTNLQLSKYLSIRNIICICMNTGDINADLSKSPPGRPTV